jgi:CHAT domain-containing protein
MVLSRKWLEVDLESVDTGIRAAAQGSRGEHPIPHIFPAVTLEQLSHFAELAEKAAARAEPLGESLKQAQTFYQALFQKGLEEVLFRLREASGDEQVLLRLMIHDPALQAFPWEALCEPETTLSFLGSSPDVLLARGVRSTDPWQPREVEGAVRVLAIAPSAESALTGLRAALHDSIESGEIEWLDPLVGARARLPYLFDGLKRGPTPHIIHFIGHGSVDEKGVPQLLFEDAEGQEVGVPVEMLAQQLRTDFRRDLRLIVLDACEGARPGVLASAAEWLARTGADAVVAHLWPVKADLARVCSRAFYQALTRASSSRGDVARSLQDARLTVLGAFQGSAEAFSPVLYLRGQDSTLFDFQRRKVAPPRITASPVRANEPAPPALSRLLERPFTLLLGDSLSEQSTLLEGFRMLLLEKLEEHVGAVPPGLSMSALAQRYALSFGEENLFYEFQNMFGHAADSLSFIRGMAREIPPGVHITLLRFPLLEIALADSQPERRIHVIQPPGPGGGDMPTVMRHEPGEQRWTQLMEVPESFDPQQEIIVLRLYRGYLPPNLFNRPMLTEDDYLLGIGELKDILSSPDLADLLLSVLNTRPAFLLGLSIWTWHHRMLLYRLFGKRPLPLGSLVVLDPAEAERAMWLRGQSLPGRQGVQVLEMSTAELMAYFQEPPAQEAAR